MIVGKGHTKFERLLDPVSRITGTQAKRFYEAECDFTKPECDGAAFQEKVSEWFSSGALEAILQKVYQVIV